jgi:hypothetical protein
MRNDGSLHLTRINNDTCGNPRYVVHFLCLNTPEESDARLSPVPGAGLKLDDKYALAVRRANSIGGRKYHTKRYGGGIVFQSYSVAELRASINRVTGRNFTDETVTR